MKKIVMAKLRVTASEAAERLIVRDKNMNLAEMLGYADIQQLGRIAAAYQCDCNGNSKHELIQAILLKAGSKQLIEEQLSGMTLQDLRFLQGLLFAKRDVFSMEDLLAMVQHSRFDEVAPANPSNPAKGEAKAKSKRKTKAEKKLEEGMTPRQLLVNFSHRGWLFTGQGSQGHYLYQFPQDLRPRFMQVLRSRYQASVKYTDQPSVYRDEQSLMMEDVARLLRFISEQEPALMPDGSMYKRNVTQLLELLAISEELPQKGVWRFGYGRQFHHYPDRLSLLYDYCMTMQYLSDGDNRLTVTPLGQQRLRERDPNEGEQMVRYWLRLYRVPITNIHMIVQWLAELTEDWATVDSLTPILLPYIKPYYYDEAPTIFSQRIIKMMLHLGIIRSGQDEQNGTVIRMTKAGKLLLTGTLK